MADPTPPALPVDQSERLTLVDALRGFALCGVFVSNSFVWFSGRHMLPREQSLALGSPPLEQAVTTLYQFFVNQKFVTIFAFLFGLGFSIQLSRAESRGSSIVPVYLRRLGVLLALGLVHLYAIWLGDILHMYALLGFLLLLFYKRSDRTLFIWVGLLMGLMPVLVPTLIRYVPVLLHGAEAAAEAAKAAQAHETALRARLLESLSSDSLWTTQAGNARHTWVTWFQHPRVLLWMSLIFGRFLLGLLAGRHRLLQDVERHRPLLRRLVLWGFAVGTLLSGPALVAQRLRVWGLWTPPDNVWMFLLGCVQEAGYLALGAAYVSLFALLFQRERWRRVLNVLAPAGRMALTNYLAQSVVSLCIYYGWGLGLIGRMPPSGCVAMAVGIFAVQVVLSHWWLARFRFGPAEWLWRSLTYGRFQPMRQGAQPGAAGAPG